MKVRFTPTARQHFLDALNFIQRDRPMAAARFRQVCEDSLRRLVDFPDSGRSIPEFPELSYREVIVAPYRFFYRTSGETVWVVAVWHGAQLPGPPAAETGS